MSGGSRNPEASQRGQLTCALTLHLFCKSGLRQTITSAASSPVLGSSERWGLGLQRCEIQRPGAHREPAKERDHCAGSQRVGIET